MKLSKSLISIIILIEITKFNLIQFISLFIYFLLWTLSYLQHLWEKIKNKVYKIFMYIRLNIER